MEYYIEELFDFLMEADETHSIIEEYNIKANKLAEEEE